MLKNPSVVECFIRNNISPTAAAVTLETIIKASDWKTSKFELSYGSSYRFRLQSARKMVEQIKSSWVPSHISVLHERGTSSCPFIWRRPNEAARCFKLPVHSTEKELL